MRPDLTWPFRLWWECKMRSHSREDLRQGNDVVLFTFLKNHLKWGEWIGGLEREHWRGCLCLQTIVAGSVIISRKGEKQADSGLIWKLGQFSRYAHIFFDMPPLKRGSLIPLSKRGTGDSCWLLAKSLGQTLRDVTSVVRLLIDCGFHLGGMFSCLGRLLILREASYLVVLQLCGEVHEAEDCNLPRTMWVILEADLTHSIPS